MNFYIVVVKKYFLLGQTGSFFFNCHLTSLIRLHNICHWLFFPLCRLNRVYIERVPSWLYWLIDVDWLSWMLIHRRKPNVSNAPWSLVSCSKSIRYATVSPTFDLIGKHDIMIFAIGSRLATSVGFFQNSWCCLLSFAVERKLKIAIL